MLYINNLDSLDTIDLNNKTIDPLGELFGASQCGELNYTKYMVFDPPTKPLTLGFS